MSSNFLSLNPSKTDVLIFGLLRQLSKLDTIHLPNNIILSPVDFAHDFGVIFDKNLSFAQHISSISKSCFHNIRDLRRIRNTIDQTTARTIATSVIHCKIDYCLFYSIYLLHKRIVCSLCLTLLLVLSLKLLNFITYLQFLNLSTTWLKVNERINHEVLSLIYNSYIYIYWHIFATKHIFVIQLIKLLPSPLLFLSFTLKLLL